MKTHVHHLDEPSVTVDQIMKKYRREGLLTIVFTLAFVVCAICSKEIAHFMSHSLNASIPTWLVLAVAIILAIYGVLMTFMHFARTTEDIAHESEDDDDPGMVC